MMTAMPEEDKTLAVAEFPIAAFLTDSTLSAKKEDSRVANVCVSCPSNH